MRRAQLVLVVLAASALGGCARWYDRNAQLGSDPVLWFLGGAPTEVQLDWPRREVPWLAPLGSDAATRPGGASPGCGGQRCRGVAGCERGSRRAGWPRTADRRRGCRARR